MHPRIAPIAIAALIALGLGSAARAGVPHDLPGDLQCNAQVDATDSLALVSYLSGITPSLPRGCPPIGGITGAQNGLIAFEHEGDIYTMTAAGSEQTNITNSPGVYDWYPTWSHDGKHIAFASHTNAHDHIIIANPDGTNPTPITSANQDDETATFSPDDKQLVFDSYNGDNNDIFVVNADGTGRHNIASGSHEDFSPAWSPDGTLIAFSSDRAGGIGDIYTMTPAGKSMKLVYQNADYKNVEGWSPDGQAIIFTEYDGTQSDVWAVPASGGTAHNLTNNPAKRDTGAEYSPDGSLIVFGSTRDDPQPATCGDCATDIYRATSSGGSQTRLTQLGMTTEDATWQPINGKITGDLNCDGALDMSDLIASLAYAAGTPQHLPDGCPAIGP
ncbi:MAG: hypothetical protein ABI559_04450 [Chloroflexota bacterium]